MREPKRAATRRRSEAAAPRGSNATALRGPAPSRSAAGAWVVVLALAASAEALHLGWFADDFHFLDVARRLPLWRVLDGAHGLYPWYRPLSREVFFALLAPLGGLAPLAAHFANLAAVATIAWLLLQLARRLAGERAAPVAVALFVTCEWTRFLAAWASGFQDLLAAMLVLFALHDHAEGRNRRVALWVLLAPLAKETGFLAFPLVVLDAALIGRERRPRGWMALPALAWITAAALHVLARLSWTGAGRGAALEGTAPDIPGALLQVVAGFIQTRMPSGGASPALAVPLALAALAALATWAAWPRPRAAAMSVGRPPAGALGFAALATALGLAPLVAGAALHLTLANPYYAFPAVPFLGLLAAVIVARLPRGVAPAAAWAMPALVAWNVLALRYQPPAPLEESTWVFHRWDWREAERLQVVSTRLSADLRAALGARPESLVVLYGGLSTGCFFQSEDGPATRVALDDPTVRSWYINGVPVLVEPGRFTVLTFDPLAKRLERGSLPASERLRAAATAIFRGQPGTAWAFASWADSGDSGPDREYARAAARLLSRGAAEFRAGLVSGGLADSAGARPAELAAREFPSDPALKAAYQRVLEGPLEASRHAALAESLLSRGYAVAGGFELRVAITLDPSRAADAARLAALLQADRRGAP